MRVHIKVASQQENPFASNSKHLWSPYENCQKIKSDLHAMPFGRNKRKEKEVPVSEKQQTQHCAAEHFSIALERLVGHVQNVWPYLVDPWSQNAPSHQCLISWAEEQLCPSWSAKFLGTSVPAFHSCMPSLCKDGSTCQAAYAQHDRHAVGHWLCLLRRRAVTQHEYEDCTPKQAHTEHKQALAHTAN